LTGVKQPRIEADLQPPFGANRKNDYSWTYTLAYIHSYWGQEELYLLLNTSFFSEKICWTNVISTY